MYNSKRYPIVQRNMPLPEQSPRQDAQRKRGESVLILHDIITYIYNKQDRQGTYNVIEARSWNHCCSEKAVRTCITHSECVIVQLVIQHAMCMHHIVIRCLYDSTTFFHILS